MAPERDGPENQTGVPQIEVTPEILWGQVLPDGLTPSIALKADKIITEWEQSSRQPLDLAIELFRVFRDPDAQRYREGSA